MKGLVDAHEHWERVYRARQTTELSWYAPHLADSLRLIREVSSPESRIIDVGGGASTLVDDLLDAGFQRLTVLDISDTALALARSRLGPRGEAVAWLRSDVTAAVLPTAAYDVWHDRAVFHFLRDASDREAYRASLRSALTPTGHVVLATFAPDGPRRCSGLDVMRYDAAALQHELGPEFVLTASEAPVHVTPGGVTQRFVLCRFARLPRSAN